MVALEKFGIDKYYCEAPPSERERMNGPYGRLEESVVEMVEGAIPGSRERVESVRKQWNGRIREALRTETGFRLSDGESRISIPVHVVDGLPLPFADALSREDLDFIKLRLRAAEIGVTDKTLAFLHAEEALVGKVLRNGNLDSAVPVESLDSNRNLTQRLLALLKKDPLKEIITRMKQDVLGAYFFPRHFIQLYWVVIGLLAKSLGVRVEALAFVVLAHELAHAYTHMGLDIDGNEWRTENFANADLSIVEGLAQFYTAVICTKMKSQFPEAHYAYEQLLEIQSGPYLCHIDWGENLQETGEIVRASMIRCRSTGIEAYGEFKDALDQFQYSLRGSKPKNRSTAE